MKPFESTNRFIYNSSLIKPGNNPIYYGQDLNTHKLIVIKEVSKKDTFHKTLLARELEIMQALESHYIVKLLHIEDEQNVCMLVFEKAEGGDLEKFLECRGPLPEAVACRWLAQLVQALKEVWAHNYIHRDLKPANILLTTADESAEIKLCDFGLSRESIGGAAMTGSIGTDHFMAPEIKGIEKTGNYTNAVDIWSLGKVFAYMFDPSKTLPPENLNCSVKVKLLIKRMTAHRAERISVPELVRTTEEWLWISVPAPSRTLPLKLLTIQYQLIFGNLLRFLSLLEKGFKLEAGLLQWPQALDVQRTLNYYLLQKLLALVPAHLQATVAEVIEMKNYSEDKEKIRLAMEADLPESNHLEEATAWRKSLRSLLEEINDYVQTHLEEVMLWLGKPSLQLRRVWDLTCQFALLTLPEVPPMLAEYAGLEHCLMVDKDAKRDGAAILVLEYPYQSLADFLGEKFPISDTLSVLQQLTVCLSESLSRGILVPNIPECAFYTSPSTVKLAPFFPCSAVTKYSTSASDSREQAAVWALGILFCEMVSGRCLDAEASTDVEELISKGPMKAGIDFAALAARMLEVPTKRISFSDLQTALSRRYRPFRDPIQTRACYISFEEDLYTGRKFAVKKLDTAKFPGIDALLEADRKCQLAVELADVEVAGSTRFLRYAYYEGGSLADFIQGQVFLEEAVRHWMRHLLSEVCRVHQTTDMCEYIHESHILMSEKSLTATLKFSDFRLRKTMTAETLGAVNRSNRGRFLPACVAVGLPGRKVDIWCLGRLFFKLIEGREPEQGTSQVFYCASQTCQDLLNAMLRKYSPLSSATSQFTAEQCLAHSFFAEKPPLNIGVAGNSSPAAFLYAQRYLLDAYGLFLEFLAKNEGRDAQVFGLFLAAVLDSIAGSGPVGSDLRGLIAQVRRDVDDFELRWKHAGTDPIDQLLEFCQWSDSAYSSTLARFACRAKPLLAEMTRTRFLTFLQII